MKIGIVSLIDTQQNYGQLLQCFAMQRMMARLGHEPFHLKYVETRKSLISRVKDYALMTLTGSLIPYLKNRKTEKAAKSRGEFIAPTSEMPNERGFDDFRHRYLKFTPNEYTLEQLYQEPPEADAWITGSDQVWGRGANELLHLQFAPIDSVVMSYAASMGGYRLDDNFKRYRFKKYLKKFDFISLREADGLQECRSIGYEDAQLVPDPTFLLEAEEYRKISVLPDVVGKDRYVFLYLLGNPIGLEVDSIFKWAEGKGLKIVYVASQGRKDAHDKFMATPEEWLGLIDNAETVITNSFHGMAMSIIFGKKFLVLPISGYWSRMNGRITTTLEEIGLGDNMIYSGNLDTALVDYDRASAKAAIDTQRAAVFDKLAKVLDNSKIK